MKSAAEESEARIVEAALPLIRRLCVGRWGHLEYEDRVAEACLIFLEDLRTFPLNTGHFLQDYCADLDLQMREKNRGMASLRYGKISLDTMGIGKNGEPIDGYRFIASKLTDFTSIFANDFLSRLTPRYEHILALIIDGYSRSEVRRRLGISKTEYEQRMNRIRHMYCLWKSGDHAQPYPTSR